MLEQQSGLGFSSMGGGAASVRIRRVTSLLLAGMAAVAAVTGCSSDADSLHMAGEDLSPFGAVIPEVPSGRSFTFGSIPLCVSAENEVTITEVSPVDGENLEVVDFATADGQSLFGAEPVDLSGAGFNPDHHTVVAPCPNDGTELALELRREDESEPGTSEGFTVRYRSTAGRGEMEVPFLVSLCPGEVLDTSCAPASR